MSYLDRGNLRCCREQIIHEAGVNELRLFVIHQSFKKGSSDTLCYATMHLPLNNRGINHTPTIMYCRILAERNHTCFWIDLDDCSMNAAGKTSMWGTIKLGGLQTRCATLWRQGRPRTWACQFHQHQFTRILTIGIAHWVG